MGRCLIQPYTKYATYEKRHLIDRRIKKEEEMPKI